MYNIEPQSIFHGSNDKSRQSRCIKYLRNVVSHADNCYNL